MDEEDDENIFDPPPPPPPRVPVRAPIVDVSNTGSRMVDAAKFLNNYEFYNPATKKLTRLSRCKNDGIQTIYVSPNTRPVRAIRSPPFVCFLFNGKIKPGGKVVWNVVGNDSELVDDFTSIYHIGVIKDKAFLPDFNRIVKEAFQSIEFKLPENIVSLNCSYLDGRYVNAEGEVMKDQVKYARDNPRNPF